MEEARWGKGAAKHHEYHETMGIFTPEAMNHETMGIFTPEAMAKGSDSAVGDWVGGGSDAVGAFARGKRPRTFDYQVKGVTLGSRAGMEHPCAACSESFASRNALFKSPLRPSIP
ncbi:hypothetical protein T484DRAFT_1848932 [Baffinella frigidus]|nr:hypothetical protein T484DRAFT_1848932 [Cryptophyta sp. CCMP2293]